MALVIEDGSIVAGATSFVTRAEIIAYAAARGIVIPDDDATDVHAIAAVDYMMTQCLKGSLVEDDQAMPYPRKGLVDGDTVDGYVYSIPPGIKRAQLQLAVDSFNGIALTSSGIPSLPLQKSKVGPIERTYFAPGDIGAAYENQLTVARAFLDPFLCSDAFQMIAVRG